jgi:hypothetical protein
VLSYAVVRSPARCEACLLQLSDAGRDEPKAAVEDEDPAAGTAGCPQPLIV